MLLSPVFTDKDQVKSYILISKVIFTIELDINLAKEYLKNLLNYINYEMFDNC